MWLIRRCIYVCMVHLSTIQTVRLVRRNSNEAIYFTLTHTNTSSEVDKLIYWPLVCNPARVNNRNLPVCCVIVVCAVRFRWTARDHFIYIWHLSQKEIRCDVVVVDLLICAVTTYLSAWGDPSRDFFFIFIVN